MEIILRDWEIEDLPSYQNYMIVHHPWMDFNGPYYAKKIF